MNWKLIFSLSAFGFALGPDRLLLAQARAEQGELLHRHRFGTEQVVRLHEVRAHVQRVATRVRLGPAGRRVVGAAADAGTGLYVRAAVRAGIGKSCFLTVRGFGPDYNNTFG